MAVSTLLRRSIEAVGDVKNGHPGHKMPTIEINNGWVVAALVLTVLACAFAVMSVEYTYGLLVPTLAAVEHPNPELFIRVDAPNSKDSTDPNELEIATLSPKPITSKLRSTIRHLSARAGRWSRFRGLSMFLTGSLAEGFLMSLNPLPMGSIFGRFFFNLLAAIILANLQLAWVHIVISEPSSKRFYQRIPNFRTWKKIMPAALFEYALTNGAFYVALFAIKMFHGLDEFDLFARGDRNPNDGIPIETIRSAANIITIASFVQWLASIPARAIFIRVAASLLPEEDEAIVPFDRTFGGKVVPAIVGGAGVLSVSDAWKTFECGARKRYVKALFKAMAIEFGVAMLFSFVIVGELMAGASISK